MERDYETRLQQAQEKEQEFSEWRLNKVQEAMAERNAGLLVTKSIFPVKYFYGTGSFFDFSKKETQGQNNSNQKNSAKRQA